MPDIFTLISKYFWAIALGLSALNYAKARRDLAKSDAVAAVNSAERELYLKRFAIGGALPWFVMGVGQLTGSTPTVWHYFRPQDGNPFVLAWLTVSFAATCFYAWWVLLAGGAEKVGAFNLMSAFGQRRDKPPSMFSIKAIAVISPLVFPLWVYLVVTQNVPLPR